MWVLQRWEVKSSRNRLLVNLLKLRGHRHSIREQVVDNLLVRLADDVLLVAVLLKHSKELLEVVAQSVNLVAVYALAYRLVLVDLQLVVSLLGALSGSLGVCRWLVKHHIESVLSVRVCFLAWL